MLRTRKVTLLLLLVACSVSAFPSAYQANPKLVVILIIDQFRGDYLDRYHDEFGPTGFRNFTDRGAYFPACYYQYANTRTAPGHATLGTGTYSTGHGIFSNEWWDPARKREVTSVEDDGSTLLGAANVKGPGASPKNLLADTLGDELKLATQDRSRVYAVALKDRAAILPAGFSADGAFWIDHMSGAWITSTYYMSEAPHWLTAFNEQSHAQKYINLEWKDKTGQVLASTAPRQNEKGEDLDFYDLVGPTPFANDYEFEFARELIEREKLGQGSATDMLIISLSANDILGHGVGPDSPAMHAMALELDRQIGDFFGYLGRQFGLSQVWVALSADHGVAPLTDTATRLRIPADVVSSAQLKSQLSKAIANRIGKTGDYIRSTSFPIIFLNSEAFSAAGVKEGDAEGAVADAMRAEGFRAAFTKTQLNEGDVPPTRLGRLYANSASPYGGWWVMGTPAPYTLSQKSGTNHGEPYSYDQHVPLAFYGLAFKPGVYRDEVEPIDMAPTLAVLLGVNRPTSATGRVLTEALAPAHVSPEEHVPVAPSPRAHPPQEPRR